MSKASDSDYVTFSSIDDMFEDMDRERDALPWWVKLSDKCRWAWDGFHYRNIRKPWQRVKSLLRGDGWFADEDIFSLYSLNSRRMVKLLTLFKKSQHKYPSSILSPDYDADPTQENWEKPSVVWEAMIDDMIYYHTCIGKDNEWNLTPEERHRFRKGKYFFYKYYSSLWD